jgi:TRAP-type mannitol/chloroaromatic compound transport system substrate-binding protein
MQHRSFRLGALASIIAIVFTLGCTGTAMGPGREAEKAQQRGQERATTLRIQTAVPSSSIYFELLRSFAGRLERMSGGRLRAEILPDGAVVPAFEILDAVSKGVVEGGYAWTHYWSGKHPAATLFSAPPAGAGTGMDQLSHVAWLFEGGGNDLYREFYTDVLKVNVEPFMIQPMGPDPLGWFKQPIPTFAEFQRVKYRSPPGIPGEVFNEVGVSAVALPGGEIVPSAERGVIDAAEWIGPADDVSLGLHLIWKNYYLQGLHQSTDVGEILINKEVWDGLSPDLQEIFKGAVVAGMTETYVYNVARNARALKDLQDRHGVEVRDTPREFYPEFVKATNKVVEKYAEQDAFFRRVLDSQRQFAAVVVPYWTKILQLYATLGEAAAP